MTMLYDGNSLEARSRAAYLRSVGLPSRPPGPRPPDPETERRVARLLDINANRKRLQRIREALARLEADLDDGRRRKHAFEGDSREERCLAMLAEMLPDLEQLEVR